jgi:hypothetical protein
MHTRRAVAAVVLVATLAALTACGGGSAATSTTVRATTSALGPDEKADYEYVVPYGTSVRLDQGQVVDIMPQLLTVKVGQSIRIWNKDGKDYMIGPFYVASGQRLAMRFTHVGKLSGVCSMNPEGQFIIDVTT